MKLYFVALGVLFFMLTFPPPSRAAEDFTFQTYGPKAEGKPEALVVMFHGMGSDSNSMMRMAAYLSPRMKTVVFIAPDAPYKGIMGKKLRWFSSSADQENLMPRLNAFVQSIQKQLGISPEKTALLGFSQGAIVATALGTNAELRLCSSIVAMSGFPPEVPVAGKDGSPPLVLLMGGTGEAPQKVSEFSSLLNAKGYNSTYYIYEGGHAPPPESLGAASDFMNIALGLM